MIDKIANRIVIFTDGAAKGNPGPGGWGAIIATPTGQVTELGGGGALVTNNQMEMLAIIEALKFIQRDPTPAAVFTDSSYALNGISSWVYGWRKRGWKKATGEVIANLDLWKQFLELVEKRPSEAKVDWHHVRGHIGTPGNERADDIASDYALKKRPVLYSGPLLRYDHAIHDIPEDTSIPDSSTSSKKKKSTKKPLCYLSYVGGSFEQHPTWKECEARVKGRSGAKFKKAMDAADIEKIKSDWGC